MKILTVDQLKFLLDCKEDIFILDVRFDEERSYGVIAGDHHIVMDELEQRYTELPKDKKIVVYCRSGNRSEYVAHFLEQKGFKEVYNLEGGILAWKKYDPLVQEY